MSDMIELLINIHHIRSYFLAVFLHLDDVALVSYGLVLESISLVEFVLELHPMES